jgi:hypothetical protein
MLHVKEKKRGGVLAGVGQRQVAGLINLEMWVRLPPPVEKELASNKTSVVEW